MSKDTLALPRYADEAATAIENEYRVTLAGYFPPKTGSTVLGVPGACVARG